MGVNTGEVVGRVGFGGEEVGEMGMEVIRVRGEAKRGGEEDGGFGAVERVHRERERMFMAWMMVVERRRTPWMKMKRRCLLKCGREEEEEMKREREREGLLHTVTLLHWPLSFILFYFFNK